MTTYIKSSIWDCLLCIAASCALAFTLCSGFYSTQPLQAPPAVLLVITGCTLVTLALFAVSVSSVSTIVGGVVLAVVLVGVVVACAVTSSTASVQEDAPGNNFYASLVVVLPTVAVYVLSRRRVTTLALIVLGVLTCGLVEYLYWYGHYVALSVFIVASGALFAYRGYQKSLLSSESDHLSFGSVSAAGTALCLVALLLGSGVFLLAIAPLNPPNLVLKLFVEEYRAEERQVRGIATTSDTPDGKLFSTVMGDQIVYSSDINDDMYNQADDKQAGRGNSSVVQVRNSSLSLGSMDDEEGEDAALSMEWASWMARIVAGVILVASIAALVARKLVRKARYNKMVAGSNNETVASLYRFFLDGFKRLKMPQLGSMTLNEYSSNHAVTLHRFGQAASTPSFSRLTKVYNDAVFGGHAVTDSECAKFKEYYKGFYKNACGYVGRLKYCLLYFFL